jgi:hypothetical protein
MDKIMEYQTIRKLRKSSRPTIPQPSSTQHYPNDEREIEEDQKEKKPHPIPSIPSSFCYLLRTQKALHIPNPVQPSQIRADSSVLVLERDELVVGIAAAPKRMISVHQSDVLRRDNL